jgi:hypothetical protein
VRLAAYGFAIEALGRVAGVIAGFAGTLRVVMEYPAGLAMEVALIVMVSAAAAVEGAV